MNAKETIAFVAKTASNVCLLYVGQQASLKTLGQYLGRLISILPVACTPLIAGVAISALGDAAEKGLAVAFKNSQKIKYTAQVLVRVAIGAGVFAAGAALTGGAGALVPALIAGAKFGAFLLVADKVSIVAGLFFKLIVLLPVGGAAFSTEISGDEKIAKTMIDYVKNILDIDNIFNTKLFY